MAARSFLPIPTAACLAVTTALTSGLKSGDRAPGESGDREKTGQAITHWAFLPPRAPALPAVRTEAWARNPVDPFGLSRLEQEGLQPSPEASAATLIRRVALDLTGLPP